jgi:hypothetical protein
MASTSLDGPPPARLIPEGSWRGRPPTTGHRPRVGPGRRADHAAGPICSPRDGSTTGRRPQAGPTTGSAGRGRASRELTPRAAGRTSRRATSRADRGGNGPGDDVARCHEQAARQRMFLIVGGTGPGGSDPGGRFVPRPNRSASSCVKGAFGRAPMTPDQRWRGHRRGGRSVPRPPNSRRHPMIFRPGRAVAMRPVIFPS